MNSKTTIAFLKEKSEDELRAAITPTSLMRLQKLQLDVAIESGIGAGIFAEDSAYKDVTVAKDAKSLLNKTNITVKVAPPTLEEVKMLPKGSILISFLYAHEREEVVKALRERKITVFAMEKIPRISRAQDMDALSSQATIAGYKAVLLAADKAGFFFPMLTTAAGSIKPAKVLVIGVGVAGLQAIATAKRLGAQVEAYDVRPETKEQVESLGARFVDVGIEAKGDGGYARELTQEEKDKQREVLKKHVGASDVIITTAGVPGRKAPLIVSEDMLDIMKPGSVVVDIMAEMGGNVAGVKAGKITKHKLVTLIGTKNIYSSLAQHASEMYARNVINLLNLMVIEGEVKLNWEDEVLAKTGIIKEGCEEVRECVTA